MPRGNTKDNRSRSPFIPEVNATSEELAALSRYALAIFDQEPPDLHNPEAVREAIQAYFQNCERNGIRPANLGLYATLGLTKQDVSNIIHGRVKVNQETVDLLKKAKRALSSYREGLAITGKLNPATAIFWAKNFDQMSDVQTFEVTTGRSQAPQLSQEDLAKRIPVYSDAEQGPE